MEFIIMDCLVARKARKLNCIVLVLRRVGAMCKTRGLLPLNSSKTFLNEQVVITAAIMQ